MALTALTAFLPSIISKSIFAPRRADKSLESSNTPTSLLNAGIAVMQLSKLGDGVVAIRNENKAKSKALMHSGHELAGSTSIFSDISKVTNNITKHVSINGLIGVAALANALSADDKETALIQNAGMYGGMLAFEGAHKIICGTVDINGDKINEKEGLYREYECLKKPIDSFKSLCEKQAEAMKDSGEVKKVVAKVVKNAPLIIKGLSFAGVSIGGSALGYNLFGKVAEAVTGREVA